MPPLHASPWQLYDSQFLIFKRKCSGYAITICKAYVKKEVGSKNAY